MKNLDYTCHNLEGPCPPTDTNCILKSTKSSATKAVSKDSLVTPLPEGAEIRPDKISGAVKAVDVNCPDRIDDLLDNHAFLKAFFQLVMGDYVRYADECYACESHFWNAYWSGVADSMMTVHAMRENGEVIPTPEWIEGIVKDTIEAGNKIDFRQVLKDLETAAEKEYYGPFADLMEADKSKEEEYKPEGEYHDDPDFI
jgi:hypothetical protein